MAKILYAARDLLSVKHGIIAHACNTEGAMGSGIAPLIAKQYPKALVVYREQHNKAVTLANQQGDPFGYAKMLLGRCTFAQEGEVFVANMVTQTLNNDFNGHPTSLDAIEACMQALNRNYPAVCKKLSVEAVPLNMPLICAVRGGVDWPITAAIVEQTLTIPEVIVNILPKEWKEFSKRGWIPAEPTYKG